MKKPRKHLLLRTREKQQQQQKTKTGAPEVKAKLWNKGGKYKV